MRKIFAISMVKNEADIIESFIRYHLNICDGIVILDNGSTDNTITIIEKLMAEGVSLYLMHDTSLDYTQSEKTTRLLYHTFVEFNPDIILPLDADEFVVSANDCEHPRQILEAIDLNKVYYNRNREYIPNMMDHQTNRFIPKSIQHSRGDDNWFKVVITKEIASSYLPVITMGNHDLQFNGPIEEPIEKEIIEELRLAHFSIRSFEQAKSKIIVGWLNNLSRHNRNPGEVYHWEQWFNQLKEDEGMRFQDFIVGYYDGLSGEPHPIDLSFCKSIGIKYTKANEVNAMRNLLEFCEALAEDYANLKRNL